MGTAGGRLGLAVLVVVLWLSSFVGWCAQSKGSGAKANPEPVADTAALKAGDVKTNPKDGAEMVWVPAGEFTMGSTDEEIAAVVKKSFGTPRVLCESEGPQHKVYLDGYWIYKYEVTVAQYRKFCEATGKKMSDAPADFRKADCPMVAGIMWQDAVAYAKWAGCLLPTEAQWEKAARWDPATSHPNVYPWGDVIDPEKCYSGFQSVAPVGSYPNGTSPYGCQQMVGNVWEWCADWYDPNYYRSTPSRNPKGPAEPVQFQVKDTHESGHVVRGGPFFSDIYGTGTFRCAARSYDGSMAIFWTYYGFRCAKAP